ncbi:thioredoxin domain-containing protein [Flavobacterium pallidum]|uniref:Thioredoxin n=1 Tax=Flavobacterium pallidum TaxID=2172098 RepID=A0A2S1SHM2_9FLAO|nr:thioredoxin domain-containing protein [Flavobacterium pallidum]AWI25842.1 thioredoxin [Flavobacterium pallidum]
MKLRLVLPLLICFILGSCQAQPSKKYESIPALAFAEKIKTTPEAQILDVRTPEEYNDQHIDNAKNVNWNSDDFAQKVATYDKSKPVFVYCMSGGRSKQAAAKLSEMGFTSIYELQGGIMKWNAAGLAPKSDRIVGMCPQEYKELLNTDKKVLINFYAEWCEPCKKMAPYITRMQSDMKDKVVIVRLNADENKTLMSEMKIDELPALYLYENKEVKWQHTGFINEEDLKKNL